MQPTATLQPSVPRQRFRSTPTLEGLEPRRLLAADVELAVDLDPRNQSGGGRVSTSGGVIYVTAAYSDENYAAHGAELWRTDGTEAGSTLVKDIRPGPGSSDPQGLTDVNGTLFFRADDGVHGPELWKSDGTAAGTVLVKDLAPGTGGGLTSLMGEVGGRLLLTGGSQPETFPYAGLWASDGTAAGTVPLGPRVTGGSLVVGETMFFAADGGDGAGSELWRTDGTPAGTYRVKDINPGPGDSTPGRMAVADDGTVYFTATDARGTELWRTDGTEAGTYLVHDVPNESQDRSPDWLTTIGNTLYFSLPHDPLFPFGTELWKTDGTPGGTVRVKAVGPSSQIRQFIAVGSTLYFTADVRDPRPALGYVPKLWKSDGTEAGTVKVDNAAGTVVVQNPHFFAALGDRLYFAGHTPATALERLNSLGELWVTDGTAAGTRLVKDITPGAAGTQMGNPVVVGDRIYFTADNGVIGTETWVSDGTEAGTHLLKDFNRSPVRNSVGDPFRLTRSGDRAFFFRELGLSGELWVTDGTAAGTRVADSVRLAFAGQADWPYVADFGGTLYFSGEGPGLSDQPRLWKSDGTPEGTAPVGSGMVGPLVSRLNVVGGRLFFVADSRAGSTLQPHLWVSDGTDAGTRPLKSLYEMFFNGDQITDVGGIAYFDAGTSASGQELWRSDGTPEGTYQLADLRPGVGGSHPRSLVNLDGTLLFTAFGPQGLSLYRSNGTPETTQLVKVLGGGELTDRLNAVVVNGAAVFNGSAGSLWRSDGTAAGTYRLSKDVSVGMRQDPSSVAVAPAGDRAYFFNGDLWVTDGTDAGTVRVKDLPPGDINDRRRPYLTFSGGLLYFTASAGPAAGSERVLYRSDGTAEGTVPVTWPTPAGGDRSPASLVDLNGTLLFAASDAAHGRVLWRAPDRFAPRVTSAAYAPGAGAVEVRFGEALADAPAGAEMTVRNTATGETVPATHVTASYDSATVTVRFPGYPRGVLPNGQYELVVAAGSAADVAGNRMGAAYTFPFFVLAGDVNRDRAVSSADFSLLAANFGQTGKTYGQGDLNGDGAVNTADFTILAANFGKTVPEVQAVPLAGAVRSARTVQPPERAATSPRAAAPRAARRTPPARRVMTPAPGPAARRVLSADIRQRGSQ